MYLQFLLGSSYRTFQVIEIAGFLLNRSCDILGTGFAVLTIKRTGPRAKLSHIGIQGTCHGVEQYLICADYRHERRTERTAFDAFIARVRSRCCFCRCLCCGRHRILPISEGGVVNFAVYALALFLTMSSSFTQQQSQTPSTSPPYTNPPTFPE